MKDYESVFETSRNEKKGLTLYVNGLTISGLVVAYNQDIVELRSREYSRIIVRVQSIDLAAIS